MAKKLQTYAEKIKEKRKATYTKDSPALRTQDLARLLEMVKQRPYGASAFYQTYFPARTVASVNQLLATLKERGVIHFINHRGWEINTDGKQ